MKVYLVKAVLKATENNPTFKGMEEINYYGKDCKRLASFGSVTEVFHTAQDFYRWEVAEYGYKRKCDALKSWIYKNPENSEHWKSVTSIEEMEI